MTDYRFVMSLLVQGSSYREIEAMAGCSHRSIAKARKAVEERGLTTTEQVEGLSAEDLDELFTDGRKFTSELFVDFDVEAMVNARIGRKKPPLKVLWARYLETDASAGVRHYGYERFCQIVAEHVRTHDLSAPIAHVPGHTMQVDWAGTKMAIVDPITQKVTGVHMFVASLPFSGMVFARGCLDEKLGSWLDAHRRAFEYFDGVSQVTIPDNASTASNAISRYDKTREVNRSYADFLEYYRTAAVPTRSYRPKDKGHVEAGVKIVTNWVIHRLADRRFASLEDLNEAVADAVEAINDRTPFRGENTSRNQWLAATEHDQLLRLPATPWQPVSWRRAKVHRDWHIQLGTIKYSVPHAFAGQSVEARISGFDIDIMADGAIIASHQQGVHRNGYVTDPEHAPARYEAVSGLWTRAYFLRQAAKVGPYTVEALTSLLDAKAIEAQGFRACMNILSLGKGTNRPLLEAACQQLCDTDQARRRPGSYTAVKHRITTLRARGDQRPTVTDAPVASASALPSRDTSRAHLGGADQFSLDALSHTNDSTTGVDHD